MKFQYLKGPIISFVFLIHIPLLAQNLSPNDFVTTWKTNNPGDSNNNQITIPVAQGSTYNYNVDWNNDGIFDEFGITGSVTHTFSSPGTYTIRISGDFPRIRFSLGEGDSKKIISVDQWGTQAWTTMQYAFWGCENLQGNANDVPNLSNVTVLSSMFRSARNFNGNIGNWDTSNVTNMDSMFSDASSFNQDINNWDTSNLINMSGMFRSALQFNQPLDNWNTANVTSMNGMFSAAENFNQNLNSWDTSNVTDMSGMFYRAIRFNAQIGNWDTSNVNTMKYMFHEAYAFNQPIGNWETSNVSNIEYIFQNAHSFNQYIGNWNISNVTSLFYVFFNAESFNQPLDNWDTSNITDMEYTFLGANAFNQNLGNWDTSNVTDMTFMFNDATSFNGDISGWDTSHVTNMYGMFEDASSFNQDISSWDTSSVSIMSVMFRGAISFDHNIGNWDISSLTSAAYMFQYVTLSTENYDSLLIGWQAQAHNNDVVFHGGDSIPDLGLPARESLALDDGWRITDGAGTIMEVIDEKLLSIAIYPNPSNGIFKVKLAPESIDFLITYSIINTSGQNLIKEKEIPLRVNEYILDLSHINPGLYFIKVASGARQSINKLLIK
tara:strand:+ start:3922 stop:5742 length:1821 start_codon:yes stop_codon:yes gene_type:complete